MEQPVSLANPQPLVIKCKYINDWVSLSFARYVQEALQNVEVCSPAEKAAFFIFLLSLLLSQTHLGYWPTAAVTVSVFILKYRHKVGCWVCHSSNRSNYLIYDKLLRGLHPLRLSCHPPSSEGTRCSGSDSRTAGSLVWVASASAGHSFFSVIRFYVFTSNTNNTSSTPTSSYQDLEMVFGTLTA